MDGSKKVGSFSSIIAELLVPKEAPQSLAARISAAFSQPPSGVATGTQVLDDKQGISDTSNEGAYENLSSRHMTSTSHELAGPCYLGSSIYYGGQDICPQSSSTENAGLYHNDDEEEYSTREGFSLPCGGNWWWEGSLYY